jgi:hypothetical protein
MRRFAASAAATSAKGSGTTAVTAPPAAPPPAPRARPPRRAEKQLALGQPQEAVGVEDVAPPLGQALRAQPSRPA